MLCTVVMYCILKKIPSISICLRFCLFVSLTLSFFPLFFCSLSLIFFPLFVSPFILSLSPFPFSLSFSILSLSLSRLVKVLNTNNMCTKNRSNTLAYYPFSVAKREKVFKDWCSKCRFFSVTVGIKLNRRMKVKSHELLFIGQCHKTFLWIKHLRSSLSKL